ncbi:MAG: DNA polymerase I [Anaerolineales bacterium]|nr:DNA polymerase I [Anaerolineales bacterium]
MPSKPRLFLIDGHALAYRTYFALTGVGGGTRWITKSGEPTAGTYGFTAVLLRLLESESPEYLAVSFDTGKTFRDDLYPEYKATREKMPDDLRLQINRIREVVDAFGIPILEAEGYEADDVLGTVARLASNEGVEVIILTGDRDLLQLVDDNVVIRLAGQKLSEAVDYGPKQVRARYSLEPSQLVDHKAMVGDSSDNIPGVRGIGEKTSVKLLQEYGDLDSIYEHLEDIPKRFQSKLEENREIAYLSRKLGEIVTDVPIEFNLDACQAIGYDRNGLEKLFRELEFRTLVDKIPGGAGPVAVGQLNMFTSSAATPAKSLIKTIVVDSPEALARLKAELRVAKQIAFDTETTSTDPITADLVGISLALKPEAGYYLPVGHNPVYAGGPQLNLDDVIQALSESLTDTTIPKFGHNLKYDFLTLARVGLIVEPLAFDTMIAEWLCDPASRNLGLKNLAWVRLGIQMTEIKELIGSGRGQKSMADIPIVEVAPYAIADAEICLRLIPQLKRELEEKSQMLVFEEVEMPFIPILADMELAGISLDTGFLAELSKNMSAKLETTEQRIYEIVGHGFNINSTQQLSTVLFEELGLEPPGRTRRTASGHYSTAAAVLDELREGHPIIDLILEQREIAKLKSTYADSFPQQVNPKTNRVHTSYNQTGSVTGRLASSSPNLQNIPIRTDLGREIRRAFIPAVGQFLLSVDYSQIELRIVAHIANDKAMIAAFQDDQDIHATTAAAIYGASIEDVTPAMRRHAKAINFGLIYGMSPFGLTRTTDLTLAEAENFVTAYFDRFPSVKSYLENIRHEVSEKGYVTTLLGRRRYFPQLLNGASVSEMARARANREAINAPIQGTAADIIKLAMLKLPDRLAGTSLAARMLLQVHDELVLECPEAELEQTAAIVQDVMQDAYDLVVPLKTDAKAGSNWADMQAL